jgi:hypothetical protein
MLNKRYEPIPKNTISLTDGFQKFIQVRFPNLCDHERDAEAALCSVGTFELVKISDQVSQYQFREAPPTPEINKYDAVCRQAEQSFREWVPREDVKAYVLDPNTGEWRQIDGSGWLSGCNFLPGIHEDFVTPDDMNLQGPSDAQFDGVLSKVFFDAEEFETKLQGQQAVLDLNPSLSAPKKMIELDSGLHSIMSDLLTKGEAASIAEAARQVAPRAKRRGTLESVIKRLERGYSRQQKAPKKSY